jgi:WD40 repeat protein
LSSEAKPLALEGHNGSVLTVAFSPDGGRIVTGSDDQTVKIWQAATGRELLTLKGHAAPVVSVGFSPDGHEIVTGDDARTTRTWRAASEKEVAVWLAAEHRIQEDTAALERERAQAWERERIARAGDEGAIKQWLILAPVPVSPTNLALGLEQQQLDNEAQLRPRSGDRSEAGGRALVWNEVRMGDYVIDFNRFVGDATENCVGYAVCYLAAEHEQTSLRMLIGRDDMAKIYLNGQQIYDSPYLRSFRRDDEEIGSISLKQGTNVLVFKVLNSTGGWVGSIRFTDAAGAPVRGIRVTLDPDFKNQR